MVGLFWWRYLHVVKMNFLEVREQDHFYFDKLISLEHIDMQRIFQNIIRQNGFTDKPKPLMSNDSNYVMLYVCQS